MQTPFSPVSFGKSFMKIRSAIPENGCLMRKIALHGGGVNYSTSHVELRVSYSFLSQSVNGALLAFISDDVLCIN